MKTKYKFIEFRKEDNNLYYIWNHRYNQYLGELKYNATKKWEEWEFLPDSYTAFTHQCLEDIIHFIKQLKDLKMEHSKQEKEIYKLAELLMQSKNLEASATILRDFAEKCYQEGAIDAQNDAAKEIRKYYVEGGR